MTTRWISPGSSWAALVVAVAACGPETSHGTLPKPTETLALESGNEPAIRAMLTGSVTNGGLYFADPTCATQFATPGDVPEAQLDAFAHCLAELHWQASPRKDLLDDLVVLNYAPGFEIEARVTRERQLAWIGFVSHRDLGVQAASITPEAFDALRTAGEPDGPLDPAAASALELDQDVGHGAYAWFLACIDDQGVPNGLFVRKMTSEKAVHVFADAATKWTFKPFTVAGQAMPVCSLVRMSYPPARTAEQTLPLPSSATNVEEVTPKATEAHRVAGTKLIEPDDTTKTALHQVGDGRLIGVFKLCLDAEGNVDHVKVLRSTASVRYDNKIIHTIKTTWRYSPFILDGVATPVCTAVTFIYTQR